MTRKMLLCSAIVMATLSPIAASAQSATQSTDASYCRALAEKYDRYLDMSSKRGQQPQNLDTRAAVEKCKVGDSSGIPVIEKALQNAKIDLPPHG